MTDSHLPQPNRQLTPDILLERPGFRIFNKPAGQPVNTGRGHERDTLINCACALWPHELFALGAARRWGIVHRLDAETSGAVLLARTVEAFERLTRLFHERTVEKRYLAILHGTLDPEAGVIDVPLAERALKNSHSGWKARMMAAPDGVAAVTHYRTLAVAGGYSLAEFRLDTGRKHQIRAHVFARKCAVAGDALYNLKTPERKEARRVLGRQALHAWRLAFADPETGKNITATAPWPPELAAFARSVGLPENPEALAGGEFPL